MCMNCFVCVCVLYMDLVRGCMFRGEAHTARVSESRVCCYAICSMHVFCAVPGCCCALAVTQPPHTGYITPKFVAPPMPFDTGRPTQQGQDHDVARSCVVCLCRLLSETVVLDSRV